MKIPAKLLVLAAVLAMLAGAVVAAIMHRPYAPDVQFATLSGERLGTSDLRGKVVLVNFWATTCVPCMREMPKLVQAHNKFASHGYETIAVAMSYDPPDSVAAYVKQRELPFKVALDPTGDVAKRFGEVRLTPTTIVLDRQGRILKRYLGEPDWEAFHALVERALAEPA